MNKYELINNIKFKDNNIWLKCRMVDSDYIVDKEDVILGYPEKEIVTIVLPLNIENGKTIYIINMSNIKHSNLLQVRAYNSELVEQREFISSGQSINFISDGIYWRRNE